MNDVGTIYNGEFNNITSRSWNFGQVGSNLEMFLLIRHKKIPPTVLMPMYCLTQGCPILLLEGHLPTEYSSSHLKHTSLEIYRGVSESESCILVRLHTSAATSSSTVKAHLNLNDPCKMHQVYPLCLPITHNPLYTCQTTHTQTKMENHSILSFIMNP